MPARIRIGISGWTYPPWRGVFYPKGLPHREELSFAAKALPTIEINGTHYSLQSPKSFQHWHEQTPADFVFSVKGSRYITHMRRLHDVQIPLANFFASGLLALKEKLGPILWQFPPSFRFEPESFENFLRQLPQDTVAASGFARQHDERLKGRAWLRPGRKRRIRHCVEIRHQSFMVPEFFALLRRYRIAFVFADAAGKWPYAEDLTSDFVYVRLHGAEKLYESGYTASALNTWSRRIVAWANGKKCKEAVLVTPHRARRIRDIFVYFDNDTKVKAPRDARRLLAKLHMRAA
ncbi:MAG: DUF72 domain-containing protein [Terrimicrobiaceae bacterium]|nr:DUF72 domain-containing protein [Terrimicrobiaceae bacterium]